MGNNAEKTRLRRKELKPLFCWCFRFQRPWRLSRHQEWEASQCLCSTTTWKHRGVFKWELRDFSYRKSLLDDRLFHFQTYFSLDNSISEFVILDGLPLSRSAFCRVMDGWIDLQLMSKESVDCFWQQRSRIAGARNNATNKAVGLCENDSRLGLLFETSYSSQLRSTWDRSDSIWFFCTPTVWAKRVNGTTYENAKWIRLSQHSTTSIDCTKRISTMGSSSQEEETTALGYVIMGAKVCTFMHHDSWPSLCRREKESPPNIIVDYRLDAKVLLFTLIFLVHWRIILFHLCHYYFYAQIIFALSPLLALGAVLFSAFESDEEESTKRKKKDFDLDGHGE